ncbi:hypothetical protein FRAAL4375 [Frankia alni ACN14a]|uniref:Uncharacterized protein n=1 Tax=Frankia alni (strain DSM 45986 / CECT 9034 / ACN14a) TaxID=326424 RepID=Q0RHK9_FRAAA|nr:hypothetical protein FRAAL4375 [Frankia alni ACN14a]
MPASDSAVMFRMLYSSPRRGRTPPAGPGLRASEDLRGPLTIRVPRGGDGAAAARGR